MDPAAATPSRSRREDSAGEDLISRLPDCIIGEIVTRLPTADAVRTQLLSTRWRHAWWSSPLNLDIDDCRYLNFYHRNYRRLFTGILAAHPGPARRLRFHFSTSRADITARLQNRWLWSPALNGLEELEIDHAIYDPIYITPLPERALRFAATLRVLRVGNRAIPAAAAAAALRFPRLELVSFVGVEVSEATLHGFLAGCPALKTLVLKGCTGFAVVRINSPTITSFAVSAADTSYQTPEVMMREVVIEDAPLLEKLVPFRDWVSVTLESFELRVVRAPRLRALGSLSKMTSRLQFGGTVFKMANRHVNLVTSDRVVREKRFLLQMQADMPLSTALQTVRILALEDNVDCVDDVSNFLRCFPCLQKLYLSISEEFRSAGGSYDKLNPIECLERHLTMVAIYGYVGKRSHLKLARFFVRNAWELDLMTFIRSREWNHHYPSDTEEWIADQRRQLRVRKIASHRVKFHFVCDNSYRTVYCGRYINDISVHIHDSSRDDLFHQWFES